MMMIEAVISVVAQPGEAFSGDKTLIISTIIAPKPAKAVINNEPIKIQTRLACSSVKAYRNIYETKTDGSTPNRVSI